MELRIAKRKLMFYHHLANLPQNTLAKKVIDTQGANNLPGLVTDCKGLLKQLKINVQPNKTSKYAWKKFVVAAIREENERLIREETKRYKKIDKNVINNEEFGIKEYFKTLNVHQARIRYEIKSHMLNGIKMNQMNNKEYKKTLWGCISCEKDRRTLAADSQSHVLTCPSYTHLREDKDMSNDKDLVDYFAAVINLRDKLNC